MCTPLNVYKVQRNNFQIRHIYTFESFVHCRYEIEPVPHKYAYLRLGGRPGVSFKHFVHFIKLRAGWNQALSAASSTDRPSFTNCCARDHSGHAPFTPPLLRARSAAASSLLATDLPVLERVEVYLATDAGRVRRLCNSARSFSISVPYVTVATISVSILVRRSSTYSTLSNKSIEPSASKFARYTPAGCCESIR